MERKLQFFIETQQAPFCVDFKRSICLYIIFSPSGAGSEIGWGMHPLIGITREILEIYRGYSRSCLWLFNSKISVFPIRGSEVKKQHPFIVIIINLVTWSDQKGSNTNY